MTGLCPQLLSAFLLRRLRKKETAMNVFRPEDLERLLHEYRRGRLSRRQFVQALGTGGIVLDRIGCAGGMRTDAARRRAR